MQNKKPVVTSEQRKLMSEVKDYKIDLSVLEVEIIKKVRGMQYGNVIVFIQDGIPQRTKIEVSEMLVPETFK